MRNQGNVTPPKEHNTFLVTDPKEVETYKLPDKEFKTIVLRKQLSKLPKNSGNSMKSRK